MFDNHSSYRATESPRFSTTMLALAWGVTSAYILFHSLLVSHDTRPCLAALAPLVITWATLERKRWGRLALLGLSAVALGLFVGSLGIAASVMRMTLPAAHQTPLRCVEMALGFFGEKNPFAGAIIIALAAMTGLYLRRPTVVAEFERGKQQTLALAQRGIAAILVGSWGLTFLGTPLPTVGAKTPSSVHLRRGGVHPSPTRVNSKRSARSVVSSSNL